jgi:hypothetical protein
MEEQTVEKGRFRRYTSRQIEEYIKDWLQSGQSKKVFCQTNNLNYYTFAGWTYAKIKKEKIRQPADFSGFIPVKVFEPSRNKVHESSSFPFAEVYYSNGSRIVIHEAVGAKYLRGLAR